MTDNQDRIGNAQIAARLRRLADGIENGTMKVRRYYEELLADVEAGKVIDVSYEFTLREVIGGSKVAPETQADFSKRLIKMGNEGNWVGVQAAILKRLEEAVDEAPGVADLSATSRQDNGNEMGEYVFIPLVEYRFMLSELRSVCGKWGDNAWDGDLNPVDIISKHLARYVDAKRADE